MQPWARFTNQEKSSHVKATLVTACSSYKEGQVQVSIDQDGVVTPLRVAGEGEFVGEMAIFDRCVRSATLQALDEVRVLTIDKKNFLKRIHEDPSLAFRIVQTINRLAEG